MFWFRFVFDLFSKEVVLVAVLSMEEINSGSVLMYSVRSLWCPPLVGAMCGTGMDGYLELVSGKKRPLTKKVEMRKIEMRES